MHYLFNVGNQKSSTITSRMVTDCNGSSDCATA